MDSMLSQSLPALSCADSATADLAARWQLPQYPQSWRASDASERKWGPHLNLYQPVIASQVRGRLSPRFRIVFEAYNNSQSSGLPQMHGGG